jgi:hypothetical protein
MAGPKSTQTRFVGMYSGCDYPHKSYLCTFWLCHPYFMLQFFFILIIFRIIGHKRLYNGIINFENNRDKPEHIFSIIGTIHPRTSCNAVSNVVIKRDNGTISVIF